MSTNIQASENKVKSIGVAAVSNEVTPFSLAPKSSLLDCVGHTPLVRLDRLNPRGDVELLGKLEMMNPGGSVKDRTAMSLLNDGLAAGHICQDTLIVESTSGNLGIGLAQACRVLDLRLRIIVDPLANPVTKRLLKLYGAEVEVVEKRNGENSYLEARLRRVREIVQTHKNAFWLNQYSSEANPQAHHQTMSELLSQAGGDLDRIYLATSTCGTLVGCQEFIETLGKEIEVCAVDSAGSVIFQDPSIASKHARKLPGHGSSRRSDFLRNRRYPSRISHVSDWDCVEGCLHLLNTEGILAGASSGGVVSAFLREASELPSDARVALLLCDRGERYLDTVYSEDWVATNLAA